MVLVVRANEKQLMSFPRLVVEAHGQQSQNGRQLSGQRWTTWFVLKEGIKPSNIHRWRQQRFLHKVSHRVQILVTLLHTWKEASQYNGNSIDIHNPQNFSDLRGILIVDWLSTGMTINSDGYCETLTSLRCRIQQQCEGKWSGKTMSQHNIVSCTDQSQNLWGINITRVHCDASSSMFTQPGSIWLHSVRHQGCSMWREISILWLLSMYCDH